MFIKSKKQEPIINLDRVCMLTQRYDEESIKFYYSDDGFSYYEYNYTEERDEDFEEIRKLLNVVEFK